MRHILFSAAGFEAHSAPVLAGLAGLAAFLYFRSRRDYAGLSLDDFWGLMLAMILGVIGGALAFYILAYSKGPAENLRYLFAAKKIPGGSFWGAFWTTIGLSYVYCRVKKLEAGPVADVTSVSSVLALSIMRLGCLLNGCCHGRPTTLPWGIIFSDPRCSVGGALLGRPLHPSQLYEAAGCLAIFLVAHFALLRRSRLAPGGTFAVTIAAYSVLRFFVDFTRGGDPGIFMVLGLTTAQFISILSASGSVLWYLMKIRRD
jgi:phosphatidylglycerol:prolipoprotein diacylglycerol transferase